MSLRINFNGQQVGRTFVYGVRKWPQRSKQAALAAAQEVSDNIKIKGGSDITGAGKFGSRWTESLHADVSDDGLRVLVSVFSTIPYFGVFEYGATIKGQPLLWIPLSFAGIPPGTSARDYGPLFCVERKSGAAPLLLSFADRQPKYVGKEQVTIPQKFHIREISRSEASLFPIIYRAKFAATK